MQNVTPDRIKNRVLNELTDMKPEISVSRPAERLHWGIKVPDDNSQTIYVWLDALVNYLTVLGYPDKMKKEDVASMIHVVGKDISKFHCIYWPAFLMAGGLPLPQMIINHGHWLKDKVYFLLDYMALGQNVKITWKCGGSFRFNQEVRNSFSSILFLK